MPAVFRVYSDGASFNNGRKDPSKRQLAACGCVITLNGKIVWKGCRGFPDQTNNYGELAGAIAVLDKLAEKIASLKRAKISKPYRVQLVSDSQFVVKGATEWMPGWIRRGWRNREGETVGQVELWKDLKERYLDNPDWEIEFIHVRGHTGKDDFDSRMNELCDRLAAEKLERMRKELGV